MLLFFVWGKGIKAETRTKGVIKMKRSFLVVVLCIIAVLGMNIGVCLATIYTAPGPSGTAKIERAAWYEDIIVSIPYKVTSEYETVPGGGRLGPWLKRMEKTQDGYVSRQIGAPSICSILDVTIYPGSDTLEVIDTRCARASAIIRVKRKWLPWGLVPVKTEEQLSISTLVYPYSQ